MILKGSTSKGATAQFLHLTNSIDNEKVVIHSIRGSVSKDLHGALKEWEAIGSQSKATKCFYAVAISPDPSQAEFSKDDYLRVINKVESALNLKNQPRAIIEHRKMGDSGIERTHFHVVWSRVNGKTLKAIPNRGDYYVLRRTAQELCQEMNLTLPDGLKRKQSYDLAKSQGVNRDVETSQERKATITKLWQEHKDGKEFVIALSNAGYILAKGDRRSHVVIDCDGAVHSLARSIDGARIKQVRERLGDSDNYPSVEQAKDEQRIRQAEIDKAQTVKQKPVRDLTVHTKLMAKLMRQAKRVDTLRTKRQAKIKAIKNSALIRHRSEWEFHHRRFQEKTERLIQERIKKQPKGLFKGLRQTLLNWKYVHEDRKRLIEHDTKRQALEQAQAQELERIERQRELIRQQELKEARTIEKLSKRLAIQKKEVLDQSLRQQRYDSQVKEKQHSLSL